MKVAYFLLMKPLAWRLRRSDPRLVEIENGWSLVNPLVVTPYVEDLMRRTLPLDQNDWFVETNTVLLVIPGDVPEDRVVRRLEATLPLLRVTTLNPRTPLELAGFGTNEVNELPGMEWPEIPPNYQVQWFGSRDLTAATVDQFAEAFRSAHGLTAPVHVTLVLDAIESQGSDFRQTILYAAMAVEILAASIMETAYQQALRTRAAHWRIVDREINGEIVTKDPVFETLRDNAKRNFRVLMHELPLYTLGKSLLQEDAQLYQRAQSLYQSRNSIAHFGSVRDDNVIFTLDRDGAREALRTARLVFAWFGAPDCFTALDSRSLMRK